VAHSKVKITGIEWFYYCIEDPSRWAQLVGCDVEDNECGLGTVASVRARENGNPIISIKFGSMTDFTGDSFIEPEVSVWVDVNDANRIKMSYRDAQQKVKREQQAEQERQVAKKLQDENTVENYLRGYSLWHMTHLSNIPSILRIGLLSNHRVHSGGIAYRDISDQSVQHWREGLEPVYKRRIHGYVPLYINPRNAMLYKRREIQHEICFIEIDKSVVLSKRCVVADGNAAAKDTKYFRPLEGLPKLDWQLLRRGSWYDDKEAKRKMCAEVLVPDDIAPKDFLSIRCYNTNSLRHLAAKSIRTLPSPELYFPHGH